MLTSVWRWCSATLHWERAWKTVSFVFWKGDEFFWSNSVFTLDICWEEHWLWQNHWCENNCWDIVSSVSLILSRYSYHLSWAISHHLSLWQINNQRSGVDRRRAPYWMFSGVQSGWGVGEASTMVCYTGVIVARTMASMKKFCLPRNS